MKKLHLFVLLGLLILGCSQPKEQKETTTKPGSATTPQERASERIEPVFPDDELEERTDWQNPETVLQSLGDLSQKTVADIGAGSGYFSFKLARLAEKVIALDIDPNALEYIDEQKEIVGNWADNIETRLTPPDVPNLLPNEADAVLVVNTFSFIPQQETYFGRLKEGMKSGAELVVVDFKKGGIPVGPPEDRKMESSEIRSILRKAGYSKIRVDESSLQYQYIIKAIN